MLRVLGVVVRESLRTGEREGDAAGGAARAKGEVRRGENAPGEGGMEGAAGGPADAGAACSVGCGDWDGAVRRAAARDVAGAAEPRGGGAAGVTATLVVAAVDAGRPNHYGEEGGDSSFVGDYLYSLKQAKPRPSSGPPGARRAGPARCGADRRRVCRS